MNSSGSRPRILIIDDNLDLAELLSDILVARGYRVRVAGDGQTGLEMLHEELPDAIILDVEMPVLTGPELAVRMVIHDAGMENVPIVLSSGIVGLAEAARLVGTIYSIGKPFELSEMLELVRRAVTERTAPTPPPRV